MQASLVGCDQIKGAAILRLLQREPFSVGERFAVATKPAQLTDAF
jgi:hypothetical protein